jgi:hypothetical protein
MTLQELLQKIQEICPDAIVHEGEHGDSEIHIATGFIEPSSGAELVSIETHTPKPDTNVAVHYFAEDGNFGSADGLVIVETTKWNDNDWTEINETHEWNRPVTAEVISKKYKN